MDQTTHANLAPRCSHVHDGGQPCGSPALRGKDFCYFHERIHHPAPHPVKTPVAFIPPLESPEAILIAATNIARAVGQGQLTDKQARNMNASLRMARWAIEQRAKAAAEGTQPDPITDLPDAMSQVLTASYTELEGAPSLPSVGRGGVLNADVTSDYRGQKGAPSLPSVSTDGMLNDASTTNSHEQRCGTDIPVGGRCEATHPPEPAADPHPKLHIPPRPIPGSPEWDDFMPIADSWKGRPLKDLPPNAPLSEDLLGLARFVVSCVGPEYPEYAEAKRRLDAHIATGASSR